MSWATCRVAGCYNYLVGLELDLTEYDLDTMQPTGQLMPVACGGGCATIIGDVGDELPADAIDTTGFLEQTAAGTWQPRTGPVETT
jgi:hypothetical protein